MLKKNPKEGEASLDSKKGKPKKDIPMAEEVKQERTISGKGIFRLDEKFKECKRIILYASVIREPKNPYTNVTWNPNKGFYANMTLSYKGYVGIDLAMNYPQQMYIIHQNDAQQVGASLVCALDDILDSFVQYAIASGIPYSVNNSIKSHEYSAFIYDESKFVCYSGAAISLRIVGEKTDKCKPEDAPSKNPPPPPPPSQSPVPPETSVVVDPPYPGESPESPDTVPDIIDRLPVPQPCRQFFLKYKIVSVQFPQPGRIVDQPYEGEFQGIESTPSGSAGNFDVGFRAGQTVEGKCIPGFYYGMFTNLAEPYDIEVIEIIPR